jgi:RNA polymerase sigma factor (sigma-70 family)
MKSVNGSGDEPFLAPLSRDDLDAFERAYELYAPVVMRYAWARLGDRSGAEEILQETFLTMWTKRRQATIIDDSPLPWILAIAGNHLRNAVRKQARRRSVPLSELPDRPTDNSTALLAINAALSALSDIDRRICELILVDGHSYRSAASELELSEGAIRKRLQRARIALRASLASTRQ